MKIALIETGTSHDECLYAQVLFLKKAGHHVSLICNETLKSCIKGYDIADEILFFPFSKNTWGLAFRFRKFLLKNKFNKVIFNTAQTSFVKKLSVLPFPAKIEFIGTMHYVNKLLKPTLGQQMINAFIKKYYVLNDYLLIKIPTEIRSKTEAYYPIYFPMYENISLKKASDEIWITIPGKFEFSRRNYKLLFEQLQKQALSPNIKLIFLGRIYQNSEEYEFIQSQIKYSNIVDSCIFFEEFIPVELFHSYIKLSDYILPLVSFETYTHSISGAFNLAFAYQKPLISEKAFVCYSDFAENSIFYVHNNLVETINSTIKEQSHKKYYQSDKWDFEYLQKKYLQLLN